MFLCLVCPILLVQFWFCSWLASPHKHQLLRWQWILLLFEKVVKACCSASVYMCFLTQKKRLPSGRSARPSVRHTILAPIFDAGLTGAWLLRQLGKHGKSSQLSQHSFWHRMVQINSLNSEGHWRRSSTLWIFVILCVRSQPRPLRWEFGQQFEVRSSMHLRALWKLLRDLKSRHQ